ncbi:MAG TPA: TniQ family protein [Acidobacteriaceae bacterium]|jgi:hypothetical protein|nr:TniQ family protein [Acidobacteriaceae bacterium]
MTQSLLAIHPTQHPTESLPSYLLRLSERNGYDSPKKMFRVADMNSDELSSKTYNCKKLADIANRTRDEIEQIAMKPLHSGDRGLRLLGHTVGIGYLDLQRAKVCPACVNEKGFIEAHWHLSFMVACPTHEQAAVYFCVECEKPLTWLRQGLLKCKCGARCQSLSRSIIAKPQLQLLDLIRRKTLGDLTMRSDDCIPERQFENMSLQEILSTVRMLGKARMGASGRKPSNWPSDIVPAAANVLADWPSNFHRLLKDFAPSRTMETWIPAIADYAGIDGLIKESAAERYTLRKFEMSHHSVGS